MTPALKTVSHLFTTSERMIAEILGHLDEKSLHFRPSEEMNTILRLYAHLSVQRHRLLNALNDTKEANPFEASAGEFPQANEKPVAKANVDKDWAAVSAGLHHTLQDLTEHKLAGPGRGKGVFPTDDETLLGTIAFIAHQEAYHIGQMSFLARMQGKLPNVGHLG
ncbi:hypothetical protein RugamoR64_52240 [Duganella rhizosphaerae]|uniref:DinB family protein n=1 Tax=Duganella rhizosphaerae TaxID=2885763 RepID=UPI0030EA35FD